MSRLYDHGGNIFTVARALGLAPDQIVDFSASINPLGMSPMVNKALISSIVSLIHYPDTSHIELKLALAELHGISPHHLTIANGSTELIYNLPLLLPGKKALIISPSFSEYTKALDQHRWDTQHFVLTPESGFSIDLGKLEIALAAGVDALFLCNPGNPNGTLYPQQLIEHICSLCKSSGTFVVLDEAFIDFCEEASSKLIILQNDNAIILRSMTKFYGIPGLRLGYAISNGALAERLDLLGGPWSVNTLALAAGVAATQDVRHNRETLAYIRRERQILSDGLTDFSQFKVYPSSTNYLLVEISEGMTSAELKEHLLLQRILIRDCAGFVGLTERFFRVAVRTDEENRQLLGCLAGLLG